MKSIWALPLSLLFATAAAAQGTLQYAGGAPVVCYQTTNPFHLFHVRGGDTVGTPGVDRSVMCQHWALAASGFTVQVDQQDLDLGRKVTHEEITATSSGRVLSVNGRADTIAEHSDLTLRLPGPGAPLTLHRRWTDTASYSGLGIGGQHLYQFTRSYEISRSLDTLGQRVFEIRAEGRVTYRDGYPADSAGAYSWIDVSGPLHERYFYSASLRRLVARAWEMDLHGIGGLPGAEADTVPAGLVASQTETLITPARYATLARELPAGDSTYTIRKSPFGVLFLHIVDRSRTDRISSAMIRADGMTGSAAAVHAGHALASYHVLWTSPVEPDHDIAIQVGADSLRIHGDSVFSVPLPANAWGIADYAMEEQVVPAFLALPRDSTLPFDIFRPYPGHWDRYTVHVTPVDDAAIVVLKGVDDAKSTVYLVTMDGDLLYGEDSGPTGANRVVPLNTERRRHFDRLVARLQPKAAQ